LGYDEPQTEASNSEQPVTVDYYIQKLRVETYLIGAFRALYEYYQPQQHLLPTRRDYENLPLAVREMLAANNVADFSEVGMIFDLLRRALPR